MSVALAWRCDRCFGRLTVRLDTQTPPKGCDTCGGETLAPVPLRP